MTLRSLLAENLSCIRGGRLVFRDVGFRVEAGQALSLEGPNGAGKSSLLRMIAGFLPPAAGAIRLTNDGTEISDNEERGNFIGWLGHHDAANVRPQRDAEPKCVAGTDVREQRDDGRNIERDGKCDEHRVDRMSSDANFRQHDESPETHVLQPTCRGRAGTRSRRLTR